MAAYNVKKAAKPKTAAKVSFHCILLFILYIYIYCGVSGY